MTVRRALSAGVLIALVSVVMVQLRKHDASAPEKVTVPTLAPPTVVSSSNPQAPSPVAPLRDALDGQPALNPPQPSDLSTSDRPPLADALGSPNTKPEDEPKILLDIFDAYRRTFRAYPAGENNRQLVNALLGANKEKLPFIPLDHPRINAKGEIVDAWGTPFFFHQNSRNAIEVRSAGADRLLYTDDDIVAGPTPSQPKQPTLLTVPAPKA